MAISCDLILYVRWINSSKNVQLTNSMELLNGITAYNRTPN